MKPAFVSVRAAPVLLVTCLLTSGCGSDNIVAADCQGQIRIGDEVFTSYGYTNSEATKHGLADRAECHDFGEDAAGSVFPEDPQQVTTWSFRGHPPEEVVGVRFDKDSFAVFVADSVPDAERERIFRELDQPSR